MDEYCHMQFMKRTWDVSILLIIFNTFKQISNYHKNYKSELIFDFIGCISGRTTVIHRTQILTGLLFVPRVIKVVMDARSVTVSIDISVACRVHMIIRAVMLRINLRVISIQKYIRFVRDRVTKICMR